MTMPIDDKTSLTDDERIENIVPLPPPEHLIRFFPIQGTPVEKLVADTRKRVREIVRGKSDRLLVITAALSQVKSRYEHSPANPNQITQSLIAALAGLRVPFLCVETHELGEEIVASYLYQVHLYHWLETNGHGRRLADDDL